MSGPRPLPQNSHPTFLSKSYYERTRRNQTIHRVKQLEDREFSNGCGSLVLFALLIILGSFVVKDVSAGWKKMEADIKTLQEKTNIKP